MFWRHGGIRCAQLKGLEEENRELKKLLAAQRRRFGYRRLHVLVARQKIRLNHKRLFRVYRDERRTVRRHDGRKRPGGTRAPLVLPKQLNHWWCLDFVSDALRRLSTLTVVYDFIRERLVRISDTPRPAHVLSVSSIALRHSAAIPA